MKDLARAAKHLWRTRTYVSHQQWDPEKPNNTLMGYSDADWAGSRRDCRSTSGKCFFVGGMLVSMASNTQPGLPALSSG
eukprot:8153190-Alexandrium_andersonii.AAC.1